MKNSHLLGVRKKCARCLGTGVEPMLPAARERSGCGQCPCTVCRGKGYVLRKPSIEEFDRALRAVADGRVEKSNTRSQERDTVQP